MSRRWLIPPKEDPRERIGTYKGTYEAMNVRNPQPGFHYFYARRHPSDLLYYANLGATPVKDGDPEMWGAEVPDGLAAGDGSVRAFGDLVLMRIPAEKAREYNRQLNEERRARSPRAVADSYLRRGEELSAQVGSRENLFYKRPEHGPSEIE